MEAKKLTFKKLVGRAFSAVKMFKKLKCLSFNNRILMHRTINQLFDTNSCRDDPSLVFHAQSMRKNASKELV